MAQMLIQYPAGSFDYPDSDPAPLDTDSGSNGTIKRHLFDDTTEEFIIGQFKLPDDLSSGSVTFNVYGYPVTAAASKNIKLKFYHSAKKDGESWDGAYNSISTIDLAVKSTQDQLDKFSFSETIANLGWSAGDLVRFKLSRVAPSVNNLSGDYGLTLLEMLLPR